MHLTTITMVHYYLKCVRSQLASVHVHWKSHKHTHTQTYTEPSTHTLSTDIGGGGGTSLMHAILSGGESQSGSAVAKEAVADVEAAQFTADCYGCWTLG